MKAIIGSTVQVNTPEKTEENYFGKYHLKYGTVDLIEGDVVLVIMRNGAILKCKPDQITAVETKQFWVDFETLTIEAVNKFEAVDAFDGSRERDIRLILTKFIQRHLSMNEAVGSLLHLIPDIVHTEQIYTEDEQPPAIPGTTIKRPNTTAEESDQT